MTHAKLLASFFRRGPATLAVILGLLAAPGLQLGTHFHGALGLAAAEPASPELHPAGPCRAVSLHEYCPLCLASSARSAPLAPAQATALSSPPVRAVLVASPRRPRSAALLATASPRAPPQSA